MCGMEYRLKKGSVYEGKVEKVDFPNKATVWVTDEDGQKEKAIVKNAIPGQTVRFCVNKKRKGHCEGRLMEVVEKSPLETNPACPHFGKCGGCTYQTVAYEEQLKIKSAQVEKLLNEVVSGELPFEGIIGSPVTEEYRNKMEFSFGDEYKDGPLALGLHKRNSMYDIVPVTECKIIDEDYRKILTCVQDYAIEKELPFQHKLSHEGYLRHLLVRKSVKTGQILVDIVTTTQIEHDFTELVNRLTSIEYKGTLTGVLHTFNDSLADAVINEKTELLYGQDYIEEELLGLRFKITPFSFFQTNSLGAEVLYSKAREYVLSGGFGDVDGVDGAGADSVAGNADDTVSAKAAGNVNVQGNAGSKPVIYDLYTGTGTIAQMLSPVASKVIGVEIVAEAVEAAKKAGGKVIGVDVDQKAIIDGDYGEGMTVTSATKGLRPTTINALTDIIVGGKWSDYAGKIVTLGLVPGDDPSANYVQLAETTQFGDGFTKDDYAALVKGMFDGTITVSNDTSAEPATTNVNVSWLGNLK